QLCENDSSSETQLSGFWSHDGFETSADVHPDFQTEIDNHHHHRSGNSGFHVHGKYPFSLVEHLHADHDRPIPSRFR
ncbi:MAG: hypothetical protein ACKOS8_06125, partial [Gemmataceae bacterium]